MSETHDHDNVSEQTRRSRTVCVEDPAVTMIQPDTMTPSQFFDRVFTDTTLVPEKRLMLAVLEDAIASFQRHFIQTDPSDDIEDNEVEAWIESDDLSWPFSFASICQALNMEPEYLRRGLEHWRAKTEDQGKRGQVYRFPFRRVNGRRHSINAKRERRKARKAG